RVEALLEVACVHEHHRTDRAPAQLVPEEAEAGLARGAEQVEHEIGAERDAAEVEGDRRGRLARALAQRIELRAGLGEVRLGGERDDLRDRPDEGRLPHTEPAGHDDLDGDHSALNPSSTRSSNATSGRASSLGSRWWTVTRPSATRSPTSTRAVPTGTRRRPAISATETCPPVSFMNLRAPSPNTDAAE